MPVYAFVRRNGYDPETAKDLTQGFFLNLSAERFIRTADPEKGKFRSFLMVVLKRYLVNEYAAAHARKRGGEFQHVSLEVDLEDAENQYRIGPSDDETPERIFERQWATTLVDHVLDRLREEMNRRGSPERTDRLTGFLSGDHGSPRYANVAEDLGMTESAFKVAVHRMRRRYATLLREEVAQTVSNPDQVEDEVRYLFSAMGS
jgi:RNA polymerase sigma-70 factor (ECF subfamily)